MYDGQYIVHQFLAGTQVFTCPTDMQVDLLIVGGGSGGNRRLGGGGGAGGLVYVTGYELAAGDYELNIGLGGMPTTAQVGLNGTNSYFGPLIAYGGGHGGVDFYGSPLSSGMNGACGGGARANTTDSGGQGSQGFAGGSAVNGTNTSAGGGGMGQAGQNAGANVFTGGKGGDGLQISITGQPVWYAGGGGGGSAIYDGNALGGLGGGGAGNSKVCLGGSAGLPNTGGGGSGSYGQDSGFAGGSGIVIIRHLIQ